MSDFITRLLAIPNPFTDNGLPRRKSVSCGYEKKKGYDGVIRQVEMFKTVDRGLANERNN